MVRSLAARCAPCTGASRSTGPCGSGRLRGSRRRSCGVDEASQAVACMREVVLHRARSEFEDLGDLIDAAVVDVEQRGDFALACRERAEEVDRCSAGLMASRVVSDGAAGDRLLTSTTSSIRAKAVVAEVDRDPADPRRWRVVSTDRRPAHIGLDEGFLRGVGRPLAIARGQVQARGALIRSWPGRTLRTRRRSSSVWNREVARTSTSTFGQRREHPPRHEHVAGTTSGWGREHRDRVTSEVTGDDIGSPGVGCDETRCGSHVVSPPLLERGVVVQGPSVQTSISSRNAAFWRRTSTSLRGSPCGSRLITAVVAASAGSDRGSVVPGEVLCVTTVVGAWGSGSVASAVSTSSSAQPVLAITDAAATRSHRRVVTERV